MSCRTETVQHEHLEPLHTLTGEYKYSLHEWKYSCKVQIPQWFFSPLRHLRLDHWSRHDNTTDRLWVQTGSVSVGRSTASVLMCTHSIHRSVIWAARVSLSAVWSSSASRRRRLSVAMQLKWKSVWSVALWLKLRWFWVSPWEEKTQAGLSTAYR